MTEGENYRAIDIVRPVVPGFIDRVTGYLQSLKTTRVHVMHKSLMSMVMFVNWRRR